MPTRPRHVAAAAASLFAVVSLVAAADAQPVPARPPGPADAPEARDEARRRFEAGLALFDQGAWAAALAEFSRSRELYPTRAATENAAICLRKLGRLDEALDRFEEVLGFANVPEDDRAMCEREIASLRALVGAVAVEGLPPGAAVRIDDRDRAPAPAGTPYRVTAGAHVLRVSLAGFVPFEARVEVPAGEIVPVRAALVALASTAPMAPIAVEAAPAPRPRPASWAPAGVAFGAGGVGLVVCAATGVTAMVRFADMKSRCRGDVCLDAERGNLATVNDLAAASTTGLVVGVLGVGAGALLVALRPRGAPAHALGGMDVFLGGGRLDLRGVF